MKIILIAIAATFAVPAAAQPAPMPQHQDHQQAQPGQPATGHDQHQGHAMRGCCQDRNGNGVMDCCEGMQSGDRRSTTPNGAAAQPAAPAQQGHQNH